MSQPQYPLDFQVDFEPALGEKITGENNRIEVVSGTAGTWLLRLRVLEKRRYSGSATTSSLPTASRRPTHSGATT